MARKSPTKPRKHATQQRSRATVDALIEATARILVTDGFDKASTNRIAEKAGVSVGSLYQYFPGKEALVAAVVERHGNELTQVVRRALTDVAALPMEQAVRKLIAAAIEAHRSDLTSRAFGANAAHRKIGEHGDAKQRDVRALQGLPRCASRRVSSGRPGARGIRLRDVD